MLVPVAWLAVVGKLAPPVGCAATEGDGAPDVSACCVLAASAGVTVALTSGAAVDGDTPAESLACCC